MKLLRERPGNGDRGCKKIMEIMEIMKKIMETG